VLVMSSADTLVNGIVSILVTQRGGTGASTTTQAGGGRTLLRSRVLTVAIAALAVVIASRGYSVLYLFLVADLVCSAVMFPALFGLYAARITGVGALVASAAGLAAGALFFPTPGFTSWSGLPANTLYAFAAALVVSTVLSVAFDQASRGRKGFSFETLSRG